MSSQLNGLTPTTMLTHDSCLTVKAFNNIMKSNPITMKRVFIVVMVGRLNYLPPDLTMNELSSQTIHTTTYQHFKINW